MIHAPLPPEVNDLPAGYQLVAGLAHATVLPDFDVETYSEAGFRWTGAKWERLDGTPPSSKPGLPSVGACVYTEHPSCELLSLKYNLKDGSGIHAWKPGDDPPWVLFAHIASGGLLEAWNIAFEMWVWENICVKRMGWPPLPWSQVRCAMAKSRAFAYPGGLDDAGAVAKIKHQKDPDGARLLTKFSIPRNPTAKDARLRIRPEEDPEDANRLYAYNERDILAESEMSAKCPDLSPDELAFWQCDQQINRRGVAVDVEAVNGAIAILEQAFTKYNAELSRITGGAVTEASKLPALKEWLASRGEPVASLGDEQLQEKLKDAFLPEDVRRALEIRALIGSASVKKLYAMRNRKSLLGRLHDLFNYHAARTGRATGADVQPQNMPKDGPDLLRCVNQMCAHWHGAHTFVCPWCASVQPPNKPKKWNVGAHADAFTILYSGSLELAEMFFGDAMQLIIGCLRAMFVAKEGHDLISSDYSAIEAVVLAALSGEQWRLDVFAAGEDIYIHSASGITGISIQEYKLYREQTGQHHPHRQPFGKVHELALGYGGWINAVLSFGGGEYFTEEQIRDNILKWRAKSPAIVEFWGGQWRGLPWEHGYRHEFYGLEGCAIQAVLNPGTEYKYRQITYVMRGDVLYCILPSGRAITYHRPRPSRGKSGPHDDCWNLSFEGWNTNPKAGPYGWVRMHTYGGKLAENVVQAVARDILAYAIIKLERAGYPVVLHVHDEIVAEIIKTFGSIEEFERIMGDLPWWAKNWPLLAKGGWRGFRYGKRD